MDGPLEMERRAIHCESTAERKNLMARGSEEEEEEEDVKERGMEIEE